MDELAYQAVFAGTEEEKNVARKKIWEAAAKQGIVSASIQELYEAMGRSEASGFTTPAMNLRGMTYDSARAIIRAAKKLNAGAFIFELARSEIGYTFQRPSEYAAVVTAAAVTEQFSGPIFIQGDHYQVNAKKFHEGAEARAKEIQAIKDLIKESINAGYRNIDIDASTIVDLSKPSVSQQQADNFTVAAELLAYTRSLEPAGVTISIGGEIGEVGKKNSRPEEFRAYMEGLMAEAKKKNPSAKGPSKVSIQTGTSHGGVVLPDGTMAKVEIDFGVLKQISEIARKEYGMAGAVQHGASTLPVEAFDEFPKSGAAEVHLATEFQNIIFDHPVFPKELKQEIYAWLEKECSDQKKPGMTIEQFYYKTRKKAWGPFKEKVWGLEKTLRAEIGGALENKFELLFNKLQIRDTADTVRQFVK